MSGLARDLLRIWGVRLGLLLLSSFVVIMVAHLPAGVIAVHSPPRAGDLGEVRADPTVKFRIEPKPDPEEPVAVNWSLGQYLGAIGQYGKGLFTGQLAVRNWYGTAPGIEPLLPLLKSTWLKSLTLFASALGIGLVLGLLLGALILGRRGARALSIGVSVLGVAIPDFLLVLFGQMATIWTFRTFGFRLWSVLGVQGGERGWVMPLVALSIIPMAYTARLVATALDEVMREEYIRTARAKGIPERWVVLKHALRNALPRVLNGVPSMLNVTLSSLLVVELLTNHYGLGAGLMRGLAYAETHVVASTGLIFCAWFMVMDSLAVTLRTLANPRLKGGVA